MRRIGASPGGNHMFPVAGGSAEVGNYACMDIDISGKVFQGLVSFGGIVRCDMIAEGIIGAVKEVGVKVPVVVRLEGNNAELGGIKLAESGLNIIAAKSLTDAAQQVVKAAEAN